MAMNTFDISHSYENKVLAVRQNAANAYSDITAAYDSSLRKGSYLLNFVGINKNKLPELTSAIFNYMTDVQKIISDFNQDPTIAYAFKGDVATSFSDFIAQVKNLLTSYADSLRGLCRTINEVEKNYEKNVSRISNTVADDANSLRKRADGISVD